MKFRISILHPSIGETWRKPERPEFNGLMMKDDLLKYNEKELGELKRKIVVAAENNCKKKKNNNITYLHWEKIKTKESKKEEEGR